MTTITAAYYRGNKTFAVETATATPPAAGEVQLRIAYCGICGTDMHVFHGNMDARVGLNRIVGHELSAVVEALGEGVSGFSKGQKVVVRPLDPCGDWPACNAGHRSIVSNRRSRRTIDSGRAVTSGSCWRASTVVPTGELTSAVAGVAK